MLVHTFLAVTSRWEINKKHKSEERVKFTIIKLQLPMGKIKGHISHANSAGGLSGLDGLINMLIHYLNNKSISISITPPCIYSPCCQEL